MKSIKMVIAVLVISAYVVGQVAHSKHDLSVTGPTVQASDQSRICVFCHSPHNGSQNQLWNRTNPAATGDFAGLANASLRCLSCHDGATAVNNLTDGTQADFTAVYGSGVIDDVGGIPVLVGDGNLGTDLSNDHPVGVDYLYGAGDADFNDVNNLNFAKVIGNKVECASCHNPHDISYGAFLIASNDGSALCLDCHNK